MRLKFEHYLCRFAVCATLATLTFSQASIAQITLFTEDFDAIVLNDSVDEGLAGPIGDPGGTAASDVWTDVPPVGWVDDDSGMPGHDLPADQNGVFDWSGWNFVDRDWWVETAGDQQRSEFVNASGTVMVADSDEWDDAAHPGGPPNGPWFESFISTPAISLTGVAENSVVVGFDSSWRPEFDNNYHQTANMTVSYDGAPAIEVLRWESDQESPNFHDIATNERVALGLSNPAGASEMVLEFGFFDAGNDWWWAVDNIQVEGGAPALTLSSMGLDIGNTLVGNAKRVVFTAENSGSPGTTLDATFQAVGDDFFPHEDQVLAPLGQGESAEVNYRFQPSARGSQSFTVKVASNDPNNPLDSSNIIRGRGVAPQAGVLGFNAGTVRIGQTSTGDVVVGNEGDGNLAADDQLPIEETNLNGTVMAGADSLQGEGGAFSLTDGATQSFRYKFIPKDRGVFEEEVVIEFANGSQDGRNQAETFTVNIPGVGVGPVFGSSTHADHIDSPENPIDLGAIEVGTKTDVAITLDNLTTDAGVAELVGLNLQAEAFADDSPFRLLGDTESLLLGEEQFNLALEFDSTGLEAGNYTETLTILTDQNAAFGDLASPAAQSFTFSLTSTVLGCVVGDLPGDFNGNGSVDIADFLVLISNFGQDVLSYDKGDADCDGTIGYADYLVLSANYGATANAQAASVPEPSGALLFILGMLGIGQIRSVRNPSIV